MSVCVSVTICVFVIIYAVLKLVVIIRAFKHGFCPRHCHHSVVVVLVATVILSLVVVVVLSLSLLLWPLRCELSLLLCTSSSCSCHHCWLFLFVTGLRVALVALFREAKLLYFVSCQQPPVGLQYVRKPLKTTI